MCQRVQEFTHTGMGKCFNSWAKLLVKYNRRVALLFLIIYIAIGKFTKKEFNNCFSFESKAFYGFQTE